MRDEILRSRRIGLNANRFHVKVDVPRKLYWADRLGLLVMADVPIVGVSRMRKCAESMNGLFVK